jgi:hypothetical protein
MMTGLTQPTVPQSSSIYEVPSCSEEPINAGICGSNACFFQLKCCGGPGDFPALHHREVCIWLWVPGSHKNLLNILYGKHCLTSRRRVEMFQNPHASLVFEQLFIAWASRSLTGLEFSSSFFFSHLLMCLPS